MKKQKKRKMTLIGVEGPLSFKRVLPHAGNGHLFMRSDELMQHSVDTQRFDPVFLDPPRVGKDGNLRMRCRQAVFTRSYLGNSYKCLLDERTHIGTTCAAMCALRVGYAVKWKYRLEEATKGYENLMELAYAKQGQACLKCPLIRNWIGTKKGSR